MELLIRGPDGSLKEVKLAGRPLSLGRSGDNDLPYPNDPWLSRYHARFEREGNAWLIKDCKSRNGTIVNNNSVQSDPHPIAPGDRIYAGHLTIDVRESRETAKPLVSFVQPRGADPARRRSTIVTSLDAVLEKTGVLGAESRGSVTSQRAVRALIRAGQQLAVHRPLDEFFGVILELAMSAVSAARGVILSFEENELEVRASKGEGFSISTSVRDRVLGEKCSLMIRDAQLEAAFREQKSIMTHRVHSLMAVPLQTGDRVIGLLYVDTGNLISPFSQEDLDLLTVMANVAAIRIEHARLAQIEQSEKLLESELAQASEIQRGLLPLEIPVVPGYELAGFNLPCHTVGGDYYDFLPCGSEHLVVVIGDVAGKGMPAALWMSSLQARVHMVVESNPDPGSAVALLNRNIATRFPAGRFITFFYGLLDQRTGRFRYANAGHNYPLLIRRDGSVLSLIGHGMVLGIVGSEQYQSFDEQLDPGDMLVLFSDGVTEARRSDHTEFGEEQLAAYLAERRHLPCSHIINLLIEQVKDWTGQTSFADDFTMVLVKRRLED